MNYFGQADIVSSTAGHWPTRWWAPLWLSRVYSYSGNSATLVIIVHASTSASAFLDSAQVVTSFSHFNLVTAAPAQAVAKVALY